MIGRRMVCSFWRGMLGALLLGAGAMAESLTVAQVEGEVLATPALGSPTALKVGDTFGVDTKIETGRDGKLTARFDAKNQVVVYAESTVKLTQEVMKKKKPAATVLVLSNGRVRSTLQDWPDGRAYAVASSVGRFTVQGTEFDAAYKLGPSGEFVGGTQVAVGEVTYTCPEVKVPSIIAGGGLSVTRTVGLDSVFLELTATGKDITVDVAGAHSFSVAAGTTVRLAIGLEYQRNFFALGVSQGTATVGGKALHPADGVVFVKGGAILPNGGGQAFMDAVQVESSSHAQAQLPGLTPAQLAMLEQARRNAASAIVNSAIGAGVVSQYHPPFVPDRPIGYRLSPSGTP